ncbi:MAG: hypothetical protein RL518_1116 [Pseudomonadota bacterium]
MGSPRRYATLLRALFGILLLASILSFFDLQGCVAALSDITFLDLVIIFALSIALVLVSVLKWGLFLARLGISATLFHLFRLYLVGYFVNLIMPSALGGDVVRSLYVGRNVDKVRAMSATLLERYTGFLAMIAMAFVAVWWAPQVSREIVTATVFMAVVAFGLTVVLLTGRLVRLSQVVRVPAKLHSKLVRLQEGFSWGLSDTRLLARAGVLSLSFHLLTIVNTAAVAHAVGWENVPWGDLFVVVPLILLIGALPLSPQGLGIQEGAFVFFLHSVGATTGQALAVALVLRAKSYVLALCGGGLWLTLSRESSGRDAGTGVEPEYPSV